MVIIYEFLHNQFCRAPSNISCMISGTKAPEDTWKYFRSLRTELELIPCSLDLEGSSSISSQNSSCCSGEHILQRSSVACGCR